MYYRIHLFKEIFFVFSFTVISLLITGASHAQTCPTEMSHYWMLDDTAAPYEDSCNGNDATCTDCPTYTTDSKRDSGAQQFDGIDDEVNAADDDTFDWAADASFSIEYWMKTSESTAGNRVIIGRNDASTSLRWWVGAYDTGQVRFLLRDINGNGVAIGATGPILNDGFWHHIVAVRDESTDENRIYVDGALIDSVVFNYTADFGSDADLNIGYLNLSGRYRYNGILDDVALWDEALTETEIRNHYYLGRSYIESCDTPVRIMPLGNSITRGANSGTLPAGDPAYYVSYRKTLWDNLNTSGYYIDFVGALTNGDAYTPPFDPDHEGNGGVTDTWVAENIYNGLLDDDSGINILFNYLPEVVLLHIGTNALDSSPTDVEDILNEIDQYEADYNTDVTVILARIVNRMCCTDPSPCDECDITTAFNDEVELMAQARIDSGDRIIIVDMEDGAGIDYREQPAGDMWDGLHPYATGYDKIAAVWNTALISFLPVCSTPSVTSCPPDMQHYWKLDESVSTTNFLDYVSTNNATCTNCPAPIGGIISGAQQFDGIDDEVNAADDDTFDWAADASFSIEYWMKTSESTAGNRVLVGRNDASTSLRWWVGAYDTGQVRFLLRDINGNGVAIGATGPILNDGFWHHIVAVRDESTDENRIYVDGALIDSVVFDYTAGFGSDADLNIGYLNLSGRYRYNGILDEVALWDKSLTIEEIEAHYANGLDGFGYCDDTAECQVDQDCDDGVGCTDDTCDPGTYTCLNEPNNSNCNNNLFCDGEEICHPTFDCQPGNPPDLNDENDCTYDYCDEQEAMVIHLPDAMNGNECRDGGGICENGQCINVDEPDDPDCFGVNQLKIKKDEIEFEGTVMFSSAIDLALDDVTYTVYDGEEYLVNFSIPAGSFEEEGKPRNQKFKFKSSKKSKPKIEAEFDIGDCKFKFEADKLKKTLKMSGKNLTVGLQIGDQFAEYTIEVHGRPSDHLTYKARPKMDCCVDNEWDNLDDCDDDVEDNDNDCVPDDTDACPGSNIQDTILIQDCNSQVRNQINDSGCTMSDLIAECADDAKNHGDFVSCVAHLTNIWKTDKLISEDEKGAIQACAAQADIPSANSSTTSTIMPLPLPPQMECTSNESCDDGLYCNGYEECIKGKCQHGNDPCPDDGLYCNGNEFCDEGSAACIDTGNPCNEYLTCDEVINSCIGCLNDEDCDDGLFCNGDEFCDEDNSTCIHSGGTCREGETCNEETDECLPASTTAIRIIPDSVVCSPVMTTPFFMLITGENTRFSKRSTVAFNNDLLGPPIKLVLSPSHILVFSRIGPAFLETPVDVDVIITTKKSSGNIEEVKGTLTLKNTL